MTTNPAPTTALTTALALPDAAATLRHDLADIERLIAAAVYEAETPSADRCVLPLPPLEVRIALRGRLLTAVRESERSDDWRLIVPA